MHIEKGDVLMALSIKDSNTIEDIYALPDGERAELINGQIYFMAPPGRIHQAIISFLHGEIYAFIKSHNGDCCVYPAPFAVFLNCDDKTYVEPDISVICDKDKLDDKGCHGAPDWVIEVVSSSSKNMDYMTKLSKYSSSGVREYWIVDHEKNRILVYNFEHNTLSDCTFSDSIKSGIYEDLYIDFSQTQL